MTNEKKQWLNQTANILRTIREKYEFSEEFKHLGTDAEFFDDSCKASGLVHEIFELEWTIRNMLKFSEMSQETKD